MEIREISISEGIIQQIYPEGPFADIAIDVENIDNIYSNVNLGVSYKDTLPKQELSHNWSSWTMVEEMNLERARYLLNTDEMLEEMLSKTQG